MPTSELLSRDAYLLSIELRLFWLIAFIYCLSLVLFIFHLITRQNTAGRAGTTLLWIAAFLHIGLILFRTFEAGRAPFQTLFETLSWFACSVTLTWLYVSGKWKDVHLPGLVISGLALGASLYALFARSPAIDPLSPALDSWWFEWHVVLAFFSYAVFVVSAAIEMTYLLVKPMIRQGLTPYGFTDDMLEGFHKSAFRLVIFGYPLLTFAIFSGAAWANDAWGRFWSWDPKETWSLITWTVFTIYLHSMTIPRFKNLPASVINIIGFICMMMTFLGVNWLAKLLGIPSLHIYAV